MHVVGPVSAVINTLPQTVAFNFNGRANSGAHIYALNKSQNERQALMNDDDQKSLSLKKLWKKKGRAGCGTLLWMVLGELGKALVGYPLWFLLLSTKKAVMACVSWKSLFESRLAFIFLDVYTQPKIKDSLKQVSAFFNRCFEHGSVLSFYIFLLHLKYALNYSLHTRLIFRVNWVLDSL